MAVTDDAGVPRHDIPVGGRSGFARVDGRQVHYLEWGGARSPSILCLHGGGQTAYMYEELGAALAPRYHLLAPDLPNHGDSDPIEDFDRRIYATTLPPLIDHFGLGPSVVVGASMGGMTGLTMAATRPELATGLVLIDVGHRLEEEGVRKIINFMRAFESFGSLEEAAHEIAAYLPHRKEVRAESLTRNLRQRPDGRWVWKHGMGNSERLAKMAEGDFDWRDVMEGIEDDAREVRCPTLVLRGSASDVLSDEGAEEVARIIPDARLRTVDKAGHLAAGDNPESTVALISAFLTEIGW